MKTIYKYQLPVLEKFEIEMPQGAEILRVGDVDGLFFLWAYVDTEKPIVKFHFECYKTGQDIQTELEDMRYLGFCKIFIAQELCVYVFGTLH